MNITTEIHWVNSCVLVGTFFLQHSWPFSNLYWNWDLANFTRWVQKPAISVEGFEAPIFGRIFSPHLLPFTIHLPIDFRPLLGVTNLKGCFNTPLEHTLKPLPKR